MQPLVTHPQYANIFSLVRELGIDWPFTPFTTSGFWSPSGLTTEAPVFSEKIRLPTMLGQFIWTSQLEWCVGVVGGVGGYWFGWSCL